MSPNLRRAAHQALDLILDALAEEARGEPAVKAKKRRPRAEPPTMPADMTPQELALIDRHLARAGYRKTG